MNPTRIIPGDSNLPVPYADAAPLAHQRAPTLMAGDGSHSEVRVWAPEMALIRRHVRSGGVSFAALLALTITMDVLCHGGGGGFGYLLGMTAMLFFSGIAAWRRPCYLTTDESGIGVTTKKASRALLWSEIQSLKVRPSYTSFTWVLTLNTSEKLRLNMVGYSPEACFSLWQLLSKKASLQQHPRNKYLFERTALALPAVERMD